MRLLLAYNGGILALILALYRAISQGCCRLYSLSPCGKDAGLPREDPVDEFGESVAILYVGVRCQEARTVWLMRLNGQDQEGKIFKERNDCGNYGRCTCKLKRFGYLHTRGIPVFGNLSIYACGRFSTHGLIPSWRFIPCEEGVLVGCSSILDCSSWGHFGKMH